LLGFIIIYLLGYYPPLRIYRQSDSLENEIKSVL